jgi:uncharacterized membrane protein
LTSRTSGIYATELERLNQAYRFAFALATLTHYIALGIIALVQWFPAPIAAFDGHTVTYQDVFLPLNFRTRAQISDMVQGAQNFFQYDQYVGSIAAIIWATNLRLRNKCMSAMQWAQLALEIIGYRIVAGPPGTLVTLLWNRDIQAVEAEVLMNHGKRMS